MTEANSSLSRAARSYDVAILGGGPGGYTAGFRAAQRGASVCCIEAKDLGGTCLNVGCIPSKAMLHAGELHWNISRAGNFGISVGRVSVHAPALMQRTQNVVASLRKGLEQLMRARKIDLISGRGRLTSRDTLAVTTDGGEVRIKARAIIIATGSRPIRPDGWPWDSPNVITTDEATTACSLPKSVIVIGGGVIGCEMATIYAELGIKTTVVEMLARLLAPLEADASTAATRSLKQRGATILTGSPITDLKADGASVTCTLANGETIRAEQALVAVGRAPNVEDIALEQIGVELADGIIRVDERCKTNVEGIYAVGDVAAKQQYAHLASRMGIVAAENATGHDAQDNRTVVPMCVYTHPQIAAVGLSEDKARSKCPSVRVSSFPYRASGMAHATGQPEGSVKLVAEADSGLILGSLVIGASATEIIGQVALAMRCGVTVQQIAETIHVHPTFAEGIGEAAHAWCSFPIHTLE